MPGNEKDSTSANKEKVLQAKRIRGSVMGLLTKQVNNFDMLKTEIGYAGLSVMLKAIDDYSARFMDASDRVLSLVAGDEDEEAMVIEKQDDFNMAYFSLRVNIIELIEEKRPRSDIHSSTVIHSETTPPPSQPRQNVRLPKLELPKFSGKYYHWTDFKNEFESMIISDTSLSDVERFRYLKSALSDQPRRIISSMEISAENFSKAWKALKSRYDSKALIFRSHINEILYSQGASGSSPDKLRELLDLFQSHYRSLQSLGSAEDIVENFLIVVLLSKLDQKAQAKWEDQTDSEIPSWEKFVEHMEGYANMLERVDANKHVSRPSTSRSDGSGKRKQTTLLANDMKCAKCNEKTHTIAACPSFVSLTQKDRFALVKSLRLCISCLNSGHVSRFCKSRCSKCSQKHHELLHFAQNEPQMTPGTVGTGQPTQNPTSPNQPPIQSALVAAQLIPDEHVLLASVVVHVRDSNGSFVPCHAVLDPGSTHSYMTENFLKLINGKKVKSDVSICGIGSTTAISKGQSVVEFSPRFDHSKLFKISTTILQKITEPYPSSAFGVEHWAIPANVTLADPNFNLPKPIDLLIGGGLFWKILTCERLSLGPDLPFIYGTDFGWIVVGTNSQMSHSGHKTLYATSQPAIEDVPSLNKLVERFWEIDNFESSAPKFSSDDQACENYYASSTCRDSSGRYFVRLPFKKDPSQLGTSLNIATRRFLNLERKLRRQPDVHRAYSDFIHEYEKLGHLEVWRDFDPKAAHYFLPHHCVMKLESSSTKLRVVFDASCKTSSGVSLNDILYSGPKLQKDLMVTLLRFRLFKYVATGDIQKMYRQVYVDPNDANFQLILWRDDPNEPLKVLRLLTVTYGTAPGAYLSIKTLYRLAEDEESNFPIGARLLRSCFYVDDAMVGANSISELREGLQQLAQILEKGCFKLSKFCSNSKEVLADIPPESQEKYLTIDDHDIVKALGMIWQPDLDVFRFTWKSSVNPDVDTKRTVLSEIAKLFDPLGLISPVITLAKVLFQSLWSCPTKLEWDTPLPVDYSLEWRKFKGELDQLRDISIPRHVFLSNDIRHIQLHAFSDASEKAYGVCVYIRAIHADDSVSVRLLTSKSRVAPRKVQTIARLELCAAQLMVDVVDRLKSEVLIDVHVNEFFYWTDSMIVLDWIRVEPNKWKIFVAHRVARIQEKTEFGQWRHIPGEMNPADLVSRDMLPSEIVDSSLWWRGPEFLSQLDMELPSMPDFHASLEGVEEYRPQRRTLLTVKINDMTESMNFSVGFRGMRRAFAYVIRFIDRCRRPVLSKDQRRSLLPNVRSIVDCSRPTIGEECLAEERFIRVVQQVSFPREYQLLVQGSQVDGNSPLRPLAPFVEGGLIRVGGRLKKSNIPFDAKHQIVLPKHHRFTRSLIEYFHCQKVFHGGAQTVLLAVRSRYWPIGGLQLTKSVISKCVWCFRLHPKLMSQLMGQLPSDRTIPRDFKPFIVSGVDFAGPLKVRHHVRCRQLKEVHLAVFVCFVTKAIHVDLVPDRSTDAFIRALKRFISDRGTVSKIFSDNATNFRGASRYLRELRDVLVSDDKRIQDKCDLMCIEWSFIPPRTPHQGGLWESSIKLVKRLIRNVIGTVELTQDELLTVAKQAAAIVNSRPLGPLSSDPNDLLPLTPAHFLFGAPPTALFEPPIECDDINRLHLARRMQFVSQELWRRFFGEYLSTLQTRSKWQFKTNNVRPGDLVLMKQDNVDTLKWPLGRIVDVVPDSDGQVRRATVKTGTGEYERGVTQLALLPGLSESAQGGEYVLES